MKSTAIRCGDAAATSALLLLLVAFATQAADPEDFTAVGQLLIPTVHFENGYRRHYNERCTATLVTFGEGEAVAKTARSASIGSRLLLSAWHCLEYYRDLSRPILFEHASGVRVAARALGSGGGMHSDWAVLELERPLSGAVSVTETDALTTAPLLMAGFSTREEDDSPPLEFHDNCVVLEKVGRDIATNCHVRRGASGGPVFTAETPRRYLGIISRGDSAQRSIFVPINRVLPRLAHLRPAQ